MIKNKKRTKLDINLVYSHLIESAKLAGFTFEVETDPNLKQRPSKAPQSPSTPNDNVSGACDVVNRKLKIHVRGQPTLRQILFVMSHELRHAEHVKLGLFKDYYREELGTLHAWALSGKGSRPKIKLPSVAVATKAERDCDQAANVFLQEIGLEPFCVLYPSDETYAYEIRQAVAKREVVHKKPSPKTHG